MSPADSTQRYVALYIGRDARAVYTAALKAVPGLTVISSQNAPVFEVEATAQAARRVNRMQGWTASVPQVLFEVPSPRPGFPTGPVAAPRRPVRPAPRSAALPLPARITARRVRTNA